MHSYALKYVELYSFFMCLTPTTGRTRLATVNTMAMHSLGSYLHALGDLCTAWRAVLHVSMQLFILGCYPYVLRLGCCSTMLAAVFYDLHNFSVY